MKTKLEKKHRPGCPALRHVAEGLWDSPWTLDAHSEWGDLKDPYEMRDSAGGRRSRGWTWLRFRCNCTDCPALLILRGSDIVAKLPSGAPPPGEGGTR